jgi:hypothetical protein
VVGPSDLLNQTGGGGSFRSFTFLSTQPPLDRQIKFLVHLSIYFVQSVFVLEVLVARIILGRRGFRTLLNCHLCDLRFVCYFFSAACH